MFYESKGRDQLNAAIASGAWTQTSVGEACGVKQPSVSAWCTGKSRPKDLQKRVLRRILNIDDDLWLTESEQALVDGHVHPPAAESGPLPTADAEGARLPTGTDE